MLFIEQTTTDNYVQFPLTGEKNITVSNDDLGNDLVISSNGNVVDIMHLYAGETQTLGFNSFCMPYFFIKSGTLGKPAKFRINIW